MKLNSKLLFVAAIFFASCQKENITKQTPVHSGQDVSEAMVQEGGNNPDEAMLNAGNRPSKDGYLYIESNDSTGNAIVAYKQGTDGKLTWSSTTSSGGKGAGKGLGSEGALAINEDHTWLFAVNAGSNSISSFKINNDGKLKLKHTVSSGGTLPVSVCVHNNLVYVVNSVSADINGFTIGADGSFTPVDGSHKNLSAVTAGPAQIAFSPQGNSLLITEKAANKIAIFTLDNNGSVMQTNYADAVGTTPFGFDFSRDKFMIVSNASGGAVNASTCTSYMNLYDGATAVNGAVPNQQSAACWVATTRFGRFAYVANAGSSNITTYFVDRNGAIYYLPWSVTATGMGPIDLVVSEDNLYVYNISSGDHTLREFKRSVLGTLHPIGSVTSIPMAAAGIVAD